MEKTSTDLWCHVKNGYSYVLGQGGYFLVLSFQKGFDTALTVVTRQHTNMPQVSLCIHGLPREAPFCLNAKKPWKSIQRHKDSIWRGRRDVQELLLWFLFWKEPGAWLKAKQLAFQKPQKGSWPIHKMQWKREEERLAGTEFLFSLCQENALVWWLLQGYWKRSSEEVRWMAVP